MSKTLDFLPKHPEIKLYQDDEMFRINTDTSMLGEFLEVYKEDTVLDIGTNNGALLLYANMFKPKKLIGIDINEKALELAQMNMELNNITNCTLQKADANTYRENEVDVIICNPPYFKTKTDNMSKSKYLNLAKHEDNLPIEKLIQTINVNLRNGGTLFMLFQTSRLTEVLMLLEEKKLTVKKLQFVYDENKEYSNVFLIKAVKGQNSGTVVVKPIIVNR